MFSGILVFYGIPIASVGATGPAGPSGTFTGPLKPNSSYWRGGIVTHNGAYNHYLYLPSGGIWATYDGYDSPTVASGGSLVNSITNTAGYPGGWANFLCWRIQ